MRKILMLVVMVVMAVVAMAQTPNKISYQAVVRDGQNRLVTNTNVSVQVQIGTSYSETFSVTTNANGLVSLQIPTDAHQPDFNGINWATTNTITTTITVGSETMTNTVPVTAVPYALYANNVNPSVIDTLVSEHELEVILNDYYTKIGVDTLLGAKADTATTYTRTKIDDMLGAKADTSSTYNKDKVNELLGAKADTATTYTRTKIDDMLGAKADTSSTYNKDKVNELLGAKADTATTYTRTKIDDMLGAKVDTTTLADYYTKTGVDTLLAAKADTSEIGKGTYSLLNPVTKAEIGKISVNSTVDSIGIVLPGNPMTLKFIRPLDTIVYNAFDENGLPQEYLIDLTDVITTQAIVKYINKAQATSSVNDVDSIYNALTDPANADVKEELIRKAKQVAMNHERDAMDIALYYFKHFDGDDVRYILDRVDSADIAHFINSVNTLTPADANKIMSALAANVNAAQVGQLVKALSDRISAAQAREFINAVIENIDPSQVDVIIDALDDAAADPNSAAGRLKARIDAHIRYVIQQYNAEHGIH